jgi:hypothetical protein
MLGANWCTGVLVAKLVLLTFETIHEKYALTQKNDYK